MIQKETIQSTVDTTKSDEWIDRAKGNSVGSRFFIWILSRMGIFPAYFFLIFASVQYALLDKKSRNAIRIFRNHIGVKTGFFDYVVHFYSFGMALIDKFFFLLSGSDHFKFTSINEELIVNESNAGNGVILLGAHFGNWEIAGNLLQDRISTRVNLLMYDSESQAVKNAVQKAVAKRNVGVIFISPESPDSMVEVVNALKRGEIVCMHGDRTFGAMRHEKVEFLNQAAPFPFGAFALSAITGSSVIPFFAIKQGLRHYTFSASEAIRIENGDRATRAERIRKGVEKYVRTLESMARKYPTQWYNLYNFWNCDSNI